jgi:hypothetical protein
MQARPTLADDFIAKSDSGTRYRVYIWQHWVDASTLQAPGAVPGLKEARLSTGEQVNSIDDDTYEIVQTGVRIKRDR